MKNKKIKLTLLDLSLGFFTAANFPVYMNADSEARDKAFSDLIKKYENKYASCGVNIHEERKLSLPTKVGIVGGFFLVGWGPALNSYDYRKQSIQKIKHNRP
jgi:hypothetical protein